jgi:hypothetical protein
LNNICSYRPTVESSGSDVNNICIENQNLGSVAHENNSGLIYNIKQEPVDDYSLTNVYNESLWSFEFTLSYIIGENELV